MENKHKIIKSYVFGSSNPHKVKEVNAIANLQNINFEVVNGNFAPEETGNTFEENAVIKAKLAAELTNKIAIADDTGLCVEYLDGAPGIYSARYAPTQEERINRLLKELNDCELSKRKCYFACAMAVVHPNGEILFSTTETIDGYITFSPKGTNGFGYDSVFFIPEENQTMAEISDERKNTISHRAKALDKVLKFLKSEI